MAMSFARISCACLAALLGSSGCGRPFESLPPEGFVVVEQDWDESHMKAGDRVGMKVRTFENMAGGTLKFWGEDLVEKLTARGYTLVATREVESRNGVVGAQFDFDYTLPGTDDQKFLVVVVFATDDYRHVVQVAGDRALREDHAQDLDAFVGAARVAGCKRRSKICNPRHTGTPSAES